MWGFCRTFRHISDVNVGCPCAFRGECGQSSVEAAVVLPVLMLLFALLMQPVCVLYTRMVMRHAAAETARVAATSKSDEVCRSFAIRRLRAVPEASLFHVGGDNDWRVDVRRLLSQGTCDVEISGHLRPLPLFGVVTSVLGESDSKGIRIRVGVSERVRSQWLRGEYHEWMEAWGA